MLLIDLKTTMMYYHVMNIATLEDIKLKILPILKKADIKKAALFGSYVRGDNSKTSDIDILVELPDNATLFELGGLKVTLEEELNKKVDVITYKSMSPIIKDSILSNQYPLL
jgi:predicted nucleotidyltransferase